MSDCHFVSFSDYDWSFSAKTPLPWNPAVYCLIAAFAAIPMWMTLELTAQIYTTFKRHSGLYFWSLLITTWGLTLRAVFRILLDFVPPFNPILALVFIVVGWICMITGFAVVLYSRLHLVVHNALVLRAVLAMIVVFAFAFHVPATVAQFGIVAKTHPQWDSWFPGIEKSQIIGFTAQETIISCTYIWATRRLMRDSYNVNARQSFSFLIGAQVLVILFDVLLVVLAMTDYWLLQANMISFIYAIKLKIEFVVLNQLLNIVKRGLAPRGILDIGSDHPQPKSDTRKTSDATLAPKAWRRFSDGVFASKPPPIVADALSTPAKGIEKTTQVQVTYETRVTDVGTRRMQAWVEANQMLKNAGPDISSAESSAQSSVPTSEEILRINSDEGESIESIEKQYLGQFGKSRNL